MEDANGSKSKKAAKKSLQNADTTLEAREKEYKAHYDYLKGCEDVHLERESHLQTLQNEVTEAETKADALQGEVKKVEGMRQDLGKRDAAGKALQPSKGRGGGSKY